MILWVCWGTAGAPRHSCGKAHEALKAAGHGFEVKRAYGWRMLPDALNQTEGRRTARELTGSSAVPLLILDDGSFVAGSREIASWAAAHPARAAAAV